jgi:hypothetical protein
MFLKMFPYVLYHMPFSWFRFEYPWVAMSTSICLLTCSHGFQMIASLSFFQKGNGSVSRPKLNASTWARFLTARQQQSLRWLRGLGQSVDVIKSMFSGCRIGSMLQPLHQLSCYYSSGMYEVPVHRRNIWNQWTDLRFSTVSGSEELLPNPRGKKNFLGKTI